MLQSSLVGYVMLDQRIEKKLHSVVVFGKYVPEIANGCFYISPVKKLGNSMKMIENNNTEQNTDDT